MEDETGMLPEEDLHDSTGMPESHDDDPEVVSLRSALEEREAELSAVRDANRLALERLRAAMVTLEPALTPEMLAGNTLDELEASFNAAVETLGKVREQVRREQALRVGAGAPGRQVPGARSPIEKIREGLARA